MIKYQYIIIYLQNIYWQLQSQHLLYVFNVFNTSYLIHIGRIEITEHAFNHRYLYIYI